MNIFDMIIWTEIISRYIHVNVTTVSLRKRTLLVLKDMNALFNKQPRENQMKAVKAFVRGKELTFVCGWMILLVAS